MKHRIVLDASGAVRAVMRLKPADAVLDHLGSSRLVLAPSLFVSEVANALWKYVRVGTLTSARAQSCLEKATGLVDVFVDDRELVTEALSTATSREHPVYEALYLVLARRNGCEVLTVDRRLEALLEREGVGCIRPE